MSNYGIQNEYDFVELFNNKKYDELDSNSKKFIKDLYGDIIDLNSMIYSWKNNMVQKTDIFIKYKGYIKRISLKCGNSNSVHHEQLQEFIIFLKKLDVSKDLISKYVSYHYGYMRDNNGIININKKLSSETYKSIYQSEITELNIFLNNTKIIIEMVDRFIIKGRNSEYEIDALVCGKTDDYVWIKKYDIYDLILSMRSINYKSPHISCLTIGPKKRNLNGDSKNWKEKYIVCIRWNFIKEQISNFKESNRG